MVVAMMVVAGLYHTCAIINGNVKCWGANQHGQLGYNTTGNVWSPTYMGFVPLGGEVVSLTGGAFHACALLASGDLKCWGHNLYGQLGYGHTRNIGSPADVSFVSVGGRVTAVTAGTYHTCAVLSWGNVKCWGINGNGQLGYNHTQTLLSPPDDWTVPVGGEVVAMSAGSSHTCALLSNGSMKCWGGNGFGQLGYNHTNDILSPAAAGVLPFEGSVAAFSASVMHTCALLSTGDVKCWGNSQTGQLGYNSTASVLSPANVGAVPVGGNVTSVTAGGFFTCALLASGAIKCWGDNEEGQLGFGHIDAIMSPSNSEMILMSGVSAISAGRSHICAQRSTGIVCWGWNVYGQLGYNTTVSVQSPNTVGDVPLIPPSQPSPSPTVAPFSSATPTATGSGTPSATATVAPRPSSIVMAAASHTCATYYGNLKCWGKNSHGQLGYDSLNVTMSLSNLGFLPIAGNVTGICGGSHHTCALLSSGDVKCWGLNSYGQLGYNHTNDIRTLTNLSVVPLGNYATAISSGHVHTCALVSSSVKCWGGNQYGQLGYNHTKDVLSPANVGYVPVGGAVAAISTGHMHTCALLSSGNVKCWGWNGFGQLGYNHTDDVISAAAVGYVPVGGAVEAMAAGYAHTCALLASGDVKCWGDGSSGQLGYPSIDELHSPQHIGVVPVGNRVATIAAGAYFSCAVLVNSSMKCWGSNLYGQLGYGLADPMLFISDVELLPTSSILSISTGDWHTCAVRAVGGIVCWGWNYFGQLGYDNVGVVFSPESVGDIPLLVSLPPPSPTPAVSRSGEDGPNIIMGAGFAHTCVAINGSLKCWGGNSNGQLGYNHTDSILSPTNIGFVPVGGSVISISGGDGHTCVVLAGGGVKCWGGNAYGQLGYGHTNEIHSPADVGVLPVGGFVTAVTTGAFHTCVLLLSSKVKCWGYNGHGRLGYNNNDSVLSPDGIGYVPVGDNVTVIAAGYHHTCAALTSGNMKCWGRNMFGELGYNGTHSVLSPANVGFVPFSNVASITAGYGHTCALASNGDVKCWGGGNYGSFGLGYNITQNVLSPMDVGVVPIGDNVTAISAGGYFTCALLVSGKLKCWGYNGLGQLGYGHFRNVLSAADVGFVPVAAVTAIITGNRHTCALHASDGMVCWGYGDSGQLGYDDTRTVWSPEDVGDVPLLPVSPSASTTPSTSTTPAASLSQSATTMPSISTTSLATMTSYPTTTPCPSATALDTTSMAPTVNASTLRIPARLVTAAYAHSCVGVDGRIKCWGDNSQGQLGYNHTVSILSPTYAGFVPVGGNISSMAGYSHTCAVLAGGELKCWGANSCGQLGYGHTDDLQSPANVGAVPVGDSVLAVTTGQWHTCALLSAAAVKCWGDNFYGQLGYNHTNTLTSPANLGNVPVGGEVIAISAGQAFTCALLSDGTMKCWGFNGYGQLGYNHTTNVVSPADATFVPVGARVTYIATGAMHTCAMLSSGDVKCWGGNTAGQLGYGHTNAVISPANVGFVQLEGNVSALALGGNSSCALFLSGQLKCWGNNGQGQLGIGGFNEVFSPSNGSFAPISGVVSIDVGNAHVCALLTYGGIVCWGWNYHGQLGYNHTNSVTSPAGVADVPLFPLPPSISPTQSASGFATPTSTVSPPVSITRTASPMSTGSVTARPISTTSTTLAATWSTSQSNSPTAPTPSSKPSPSALPTTAEGVRVARAPVLQLISLQARAYAGNSAVTKWVNGGDVPSQSSLFLLWHQGYQANATSEDNTPQVVLSDALPPIVVLIRASSELLDYSGIACTLDPDMRDFTPAAYTRVLATPTSLFSAAPSHVTGQHLHAFILSGERSLLAARGTADRRAGFLQCSPVYPSSLYVRYNSHVALHVSFYPGIWAVPRGAVVASTFVTRSVGVPPPTCFAVSHNSSTAAQGSLWHQCTASQLGDYATALYDGPAQPSWSPLTLDLNAASNITFIFQLTGAVPGMLTPNITLSLGNASCIIHDQLLVNDIMFVRCVSPSFETGCERLSGKAECAPQRLFVQVGGSMNIADLEAAVLAGEDSAYAGALLPALVRCEPFCDLLGTPTYVRTTLLDATAPVPVTLDGLFSYDAPIMYGSTVLPSAVVISGPKLQKRPPVTYIDVCLGFTDPLSGACMNATSPAHSQCAFGGGSDCRLCPRGALCPGGYRAIPTEGFWAASASTATIVACAAPAQRCIGWDLTSDRAVCAEGYDARSPGCGWCAEGYFKVRGSGTCSRCPSVDDPSAIILPMLLLLSVVVGIVSAFMVIVWIVSKSVGGSMQGGIRRVVEFASAVFQSIQLVSTVTSAAGSALPALMQPVVDVLNALQVQGILVDEACMQHQDPYIRVYVLSGFALLLSSAVLLHSLLIRQTHNAMQIAGSKILTLFFACYGLIAQTVMSAYQCASSTMPLRSALSILLREPDAGQSVLAANGVQASTNTLAACDANEFMDGCVSLAPLLSGDVKLAVTKAYGRTDLCGGAAHAPALGLATVAFVLALLAVPIALFWIWRNRIKLLSSVQARRKGQKRPSFQLTHINPLRRPSHQQSVELLPQAPGAQTAMRTVNNNLGAFDVFLQNQRYVEVKAYWWQLDCLLLLIVAVVVHAVGKPSTMLGVWLQAGAICGACLAAMIGKACSKPYKSENYHLFVTALAIQGYSVLIQLLMALSYSSALMEASFHAMLTSMSVVCVLGAVLLLIIVAGAFLYSLIGGAILEQRERRVLELETSKRTVSGMTNNPLVVFRPLTVPSKRVLADFEVESHIAVVPQYSNSLQRAHMTAMHVETRRQARDSIAHNLAPIRLRRANKSVGDLRNKSARGNSFEPKAVE